MNDFLVFGHRGAKGYVMENTIASIEYALNLGVNAIEIDVYRCASGELVVFHDDTLERLSTRVNRIEDLTLDEIGLILLHGGYSIPTLNKVIDFLSNRVILNIELKGKNTAKDTYKYVKEACDNEIYSKENIIISSFHDDELRIYRELDSSIKIGVLTRNDIEEDIQLAKELNAYSIHPYYKQVDLALINRLHQMNYKVFPFTVNEEEEIEIFIKNGVDGLFCDYPDRVLIADR
ncbi:MAG: glycerophosphodiester phosphodiesterase [Crocinitomicaceae bacterium]|jgi:glycerophosphoryl diester phosphodiesterase|nr:glycerophosphodiester phosphodiesterase [Crocinitomicaceae bacterium]MDP5099487.1 glycerophosphodiester phosphodiesterase [Crocinitomicaceae bacterium]